MRQPTSREIQRFFRACAALRSLTDAGFRLYMASDTLCLMRGDSHDDAGKAQQQNIVVSKTIYGAGGGDW